jgi:hypothetical protein
MSIINTTRPRVWFILKKKKDFSALVGPNIKLNTWAVEMMVMGIGEICLKMGGWYHWVVSQHQIIL